MKEKKDETKIDQPMPLCDRIGGERKMRPLTVGAQLSYQIIKEFIFWK